MTYTITNNANFGSVEIAFDGKPEQAIRDALKALRFRWHKVKKVWYGYTDAATARAAIEGADASEVAGKPAEKPVAVNKYGVQVGDIFRATWGYEQTNVDFFQVVELVGASSVRVRQVSPRMIDERGVSGMSSDRYYKISREILPPHPRSVFIKDQERGDVKRLKSYAADGVSDPQFKLDTFANAYYCQPYSIEKTYESWYA